MYTIKQDKNEQNTIPMVNSWDIIKSLDCIKYFAELWSDLLNLYKLAKSIVRADKLFHKITTLLQHLSEVIWQKAASPSFQKCPVPRGDLDPRLIMFPCTFMSQPPNSILIDSAVFA